jgi:predicted ATPase/class 3 adenylate cyclase
VAELPSGTVTFLFTDLEGSTRLWEEHADAMRDALALHDAVLRDAIEAHGGYVVKTTGDGFHAAFETADAGVVAAIAAQRALSGEAWPLPEPLRVRMGLHTGVASLRAGDYFGSSLNRAARLMAVAHGGQVVCSQATTDLARDVMGEGVDFVDLGEHRLRDLSRAERVFQVCAPGLESAFSPLRSVDAFPGNLPLQVSSFIGREREIVRTIEALEASRLVTLTGVGGVGKTRLALQVAAEALPRFREGAWLIELAMVRDPDDVLDAFTAVFGVTAREGQTLQEALAEFLQTKQLLLVVDNCEQVMDAVADLVEEIDRTCSGVVVLATSREGLALDGERVVVVPPLAVPDADADLASVAASDSVRLFLERARAADADFVLNAANAAAVRRVSRRLDGVPLAIELAAARVASMSPAELAAALDRRFDLLAGGRRRAVKRQQTLRATIDWSYDLLDASQQRLLARLAVFAGGCTCEAAEAICAGGPIDAPAVLGLLSDLVARSLVVAERGVLDTRYRLLETIREYGEERLIEHNETNALRGRHARYYADYAARCSEGLFTPKQIEWAARLAADGDNILTAFAHAVDAHDLDLIVRLLASTSVLPDHAGMFRLMLPVEPALAMTDVDQHPGYPLVLMAAAFAADTRGEANLARAYGDAALEAEDALTAPPPYTVDLRALRHTLAGFTALSTGAWDDAAAAFLEGIASFRRAGRFGYVAGSFGGAASALCYGGRLTDAIPVATEGLAYARATGVPSHITSNLVALAQALSSQEPERARRLLDEASHQYRDDAPSPDLTQMTLTAAMLNDWPLTAHFAKRSIPHAHWINHRPFLHAIFTMSARALADTDPEAAATIQGAAHTLMANQTATTTNAATVTTAMGPAPSAPARGATPSRPGLIVETRRQTTRRLVEALGDEQLNALRGKGATMDPDTAVAYTLSRLNTFLTNASD